MDHFNTPLKCWSHYTVSQNKHP